MKLEEITDWLKREGYAFSFDGDAQYDVTGFASLGNYRGGTIAWIKQAEKYRQDEGCAVECAVIQEGVRLAVPNQIISPDSKEVFFSLLKHFWGTTRQAGAIGQGTYISPDAVISPTACIGHHCTIDGAVTVGAGTVIENNVVIQGRVNIGTDCIVHSGAVIGCDGYGYFFEDDGNIGKVEHFGGVVIDDQVEIGANTCIDRGTIDDTAIGFNAKIDNLVHIAHNVQIGRNVCIVAGAAICGSARLEDGAYVAPGGIVKNQLIVGKNALVGLGAVAIKNIDADYVAAGVPAKPIRKIHKGDK